MGLAASTWRAPKRSRSSGVSSRISGTDGSPGSSARPKPGKGESMDTAVEMKTITREILIDATPETIWELLVDPGEAVRWMGTAAMFDLRRGGVYRVDIIPGSV